MDAAQIQKARKTLASIKPRENYLLVKIDYNRQLLLPHKAGLAFMAAIAEGEVLHTPYSEPHRIQPIARNQFEITTMSPEEYDDFKIAGLLNVTVDELRQAAADTPIPA